MRVHIVQKGDTLWKIAKQYGVGFDELKRMNAQLANPDYIVPGMEIFLPEHGGKTGKEAVKGEKHTVVPEKMEKEMEWKPTKELQYVDEMAEVETYQPPQPAYSFTPSIYQMSYMPIHQQPIYQMPIYQMPIYQQPAPQPQQPMYQEHAPQPQQPMHHESFPQQPMPEESPFLESMEQQEAYQEMPHEQPMYQEQMYHQPMTYPSAGGCSQPMYYPTPCGCHQPMYHQPPCGCHQPVMHQPMMHHQPMYDQSMYHQQMMQQQPMHDQSMYHQQMMQQQPMYDQSMYHQQMMYQQPMYDQSMYHQPVDACEASRPPCAEKEEQVKGYYEDIKQIEHAAKSPYGPAQFPYPTQQHWQ